MKTPLFLIVALFALTNLAQAQEAVICKAKGMKTAIGGGNMTYTDAELRFDVSVHDDREGLEMTISRVRGTIRVGSFDVKRGPLNDDNAYIGHFNIRELSNNPNYNPRRYEGFVQFPNFDAEDTSGMESGMWGNFLIQEGLVEDGAFEAKYIFQAGDHMGGTIHFTCVM